MIKRVFQRALITGIAGSGGSYLAEHILGLSRDVAVHGISRWHSTTSQSNLAAVAEQVIVHECDLLDLSSILRVLEAVQPDVVFHLASTANVRAAFDTPISVYQNNVLGTMNLLEGVRVSGQSPVIQLCSTSEVYGQAAPEHVPIHEECPLLPLNPYAASKVAQDMLGHSYWRSFGLQIIRTRMFTYFNPRRYDLFATAFALQVARIERGLQRELRHGNLTSKRTIIDVRDAMEAYWLAAERGEVGTVYNIGGSEETSVGEVLEFLVSRAGQDIPAREDPSLLRPVDVASQIPDSSRFKAATGWTPRHTLSQSAEFLLSACRAEVARETLGVS